MRTNGTAPMSAVCERCGRNFLPKRQTKGRFCSTECYRAWWPAHGQREYSKRGLERLEQLRAEGKDPRSTDRAALKRRMSFRNSALTLAEPDPDEDDAAWAERAGYWQDLATPQEPAVYLRKPREHRPLVLTGFGVRIGLDKQTLLVTDGLTRHPQKRTERRYFPGDPRLPSAIVLVDAPSGSISFGALDWMARQSIELVQLDWRGRVTIATRTTPGDPGRREDQLRAQGDGRGLQAATWLIVEKLRTSCSTLEFIPPSTRTAAAFGRVEDLKRQLTSRPPSDVGELLIIEARAASAYFAGWQGISVKWKGTGRRPVPPEWHRMPLRQSLLGGSNRSAAHPVASALNYTYAVAESAIRRAIAIESLDPDIAFLHASRPGRNALVFDLIEPLRPLADRVVLQLMRNKVFEPGDVAVNDRGVCRLNPELARALVGGAHFDEPARSVVTQLASVLASDSRDAFDGSAGIGREGGSPRAFDLVMYRRDVEPVLRRMTVPQLMQLTGLSQHHLWSIREGHRRLHPRYWGKVLAGSERDVDGLRRL